MSRRATIYLDRALVEAAAHGLALRLFPLSEPLAVLRCRPLLSNPDMLESALTTPRQPYYRTIPDKAGVLLRSMVKNRPFLDGNKRMGMASTFTFLSLNGYLVAPDIDDMVEFAVGLARPQAAEVTWRDAARWVRANSVTVGDAAALASAVERDPVRVKPILERSEAWREALEDVLNTLASRPDSG